MSFVHKYICAQDDSSLLGSGAFSTVHKCKCREDGKEYAVKIINVEKLRASERQKVEREAHVNQLLQHQHIVDMKEFIKERDFYYLIFELVTGGELFEEIVTRTFFSEQDASECISQVLSALKECHRHHVIHRDLKPENLLLSHRKPGAPVKVTDFGLAVVMDKGPAYFGFAGTPGYLSPEVCRRVPYGTAVDVWATGVILYILLVGYPPFWHDDHQVLYEQIKSGDYDFPSPEWDTVTQEAKDLITKMLVLKPEARITVDEALAHPWISERKSVASKVHRQGTIDAMRTFNARRKLKGGVHAVISTARLTQLSKSNSVSAIGRAATLIAASSSSSSPGAAATDELKATNRRLIDSIVAGDWATYSTLVDASLTCFEPEAPGVLVRGLDFHKYYFDTLDASARGKVNTTIVNENVRVMGEAAIVTYVRLTQYLDKSGSPRTNRSEETRVFQMIGGSWVNVHFHRSGSASAPSN